MCRHWLGTKMLSKTDFSYVLRKLTVWDMFEGERLEKHKRITQGYNYNYDKCYLIINNNEDLCKNIARFIFSQV